MLYAPDPVFLPTVGSPWKGTPEIRANFANLLKLYDPHIVLESEKTATSGDLAYDTGRYDEVIYRVKGGAPIIAKGNYLFLFEHEKRGGWKILEQTFSERQPIKL
jgi:ketosteroid isomerase-like protein